LDQERSGLGANFVREPKGVRQDLSVHLIGVLVIEWRETGELPVWSASHRRQSES
jgi:hypothetical protein